jgi:hypothetical protein
MDSPSSTTHLTPVQWGGTQQLTQRLFSGIDHDDLAAAYRVLSTLTERANALLAG